MTRVLVVDDHEAMRRGLETVLAATPDLIPVGTGSSEGDLWHLLKRVAPDVVVLDYHLPGQDGLMLCHRIKSLTLPPAVLIYSAYADESLEIAATVAGADGVLNKSAPANDLFAAIRSVAASEPTLRRPTPSALTAAAEKLDAEERPLLGMLIQRTPVPEVADALGLPLDEAADRIRAVIGRLRVRVPAGS
ncbi:MAG TPA: response regulator transcription factor [Solirubrobacteraceae bacterium]|nr:response regulator transcription factor [Solirubrobacteraceae bacterium]